MFLTKKHILGMTLAVAAICGIAFLANSKEFSKSKVGMHVANAVDGLTCRSTREIPYTLGTAKFLIPNAYLDPSYHHDPVNHKNPVPFINIRLYKNNSAPVCERGNLGKGRVILPTLHPITPGYFPKIRSVYDRLLNTPVTGEEKNFDLYRSSKVVETGDLKGAKDLLLPHDPQYKDRLFIVCARLGFGSKVGQRGGCQIYALITDNVYVDYVIPNKDLSNYAQIHEKIKDLILSFLQPR